MRRGRVCVGFVGTMVSLHSSLLRQDSLLTSASRSGPEVKAEFNEIKVGLAEELRATEGLRSRELMEPANRYRLLLAFGIFLGQQCTGMTALAYFGEHDDCPGLGIWSKTPANHATISTRSPPILQSPRRSRQSKPPNHGSLRGGEVHHVRHVSTPTLTFRPNIVSAHQLNSRARYILFFSEKWNRRPTLYISGLLMACCFVIVNVVNKTTPGPKNHQATPAGIATVAMVFLTNSIYQFSWGPLPWPYAAEVSPPLLNPHHTL